MISVRRVNQMKSIISGLTKSGHGLATSKLLADNFNLTATELGGAITAVTND